MSDEAKVISILIGCLTALGLVSIVGYFENEGKYIEAGYVQVQNVGSTGIHWVKP